MSMLKVIVRGDRLLIRKFDKARRFIPDELVRAGEEALEEIFLNVPPYPPPPLGSTYVRTFNLEDALTHDMDAGTMVESLSEVRKISGGVEIVYGVGDYGPMVVGPGVQAWMHKGRWWTLLDVLNRSRADIINSFHKGKERAFRRAGIGITGR